jgi:hypothetical protein
VLDVRLQTHCFPFVSWATSVVSLQHVPVFNARQSSAARRYPTAL